MAMNAEQQLVLILAFCLVLLGSWEIKLPSVPAETTGPSNEEAIETLPDGNYQFCSQPEPSDWRLGEGICFWFRKTGKQLVGYYGYPHSDVFIDCVSGQVEGNLVTGKALVISWPGASWDEVPQAPFFWDREGYLQLSQGTIVHSENDETGRIDWIQFRGAKLVLNGFYRYSAAKVNQMKPPPTSCNVSEWLERH
jgi:hypothetical protein